MNQRLSECVFALSLVLSCSGRSPSAPGGLAPKKQQPIEDPNTPRSFMAEGFITDNDLAELGLFEGDNPSAISAEAASFRNDLAKQLEANPIDAGSCERFDRSTEPARVKLLDAGAEPRSVLRYALPPGLHGRFALVSQVSLRAPEGGSCSMPVVRVELNFRSTNAADGSMDLSFETERLFVFEYGDPYVHEAVASMLTPLTAEVQMHVNPTGQVCGSRYVASDWALSHARAFVYDLVEALARMVVPVPSQPVGLGASWEVTELLASGVVRRAQYTLTAASSDSFEVLVSSFAHGAGHPDREPWPLALLNCVPVEGDEDLGVRHTQEVERGALHIGLQQITRGVELRRESLLLAGTKLVRVNESTISLLPALDGFDAYALPRRAPTKHKAPAE